MVIRSPTELDFIGGDPALDLANTVGGPRGVEPDEEFLAGYEDLATWAALAGVLDQATAERIRAAARRRPGDAEGAYGRARELRGAITAVFSAVAIGNEPPRAALDALAAFDSEALAHARLAPAGDGFELVWDGDDLERPLWPLAVAAVDLLRSGPLDRVKLCHDCCWMFVDTSKNRSRRWCSMNHCGGVAKMRRYRARQRATEYR